MAKGKKMNETNLAVADHESLFFVLYSFRALDSFLVIQGGTRFPELKPRLAYLLKEALIYRFLVKVPQNLSSLCSIQSLSQSSSVSEGSFGKRQRE